jgi:hypothetical protein
MFKTFHVGLLAVLGTNGPVIAFTEHFHYALAVRLSVWLLTYYSLQLSGESLIGRDPIDGLRSSHNGPDLR